MYVISRSVGGSSLNGKEYCQDKNGNEMAFDTHADCTNYLLDQGIKPNELVFFDYEQVIDGTNWAPSWLERKSK